MIDKQYHKDKAMEFCGHDSCYIHTEMKNGKHPETVLCGDFHALMWGVVAEISRLAEKLGTGWVDALGMIHALKTYGYEEVTRDLDKSDMQMMEGTDYEEEMIKQIRLEEEKRANLENANLKIDLKNAEKKIRQLENQLRLVKENAEKESNALKADKLKLSKECNELEARMKEMEKKWINDCK